MLALELFDSQPYIGTYRCTDGNYKRVSAKVHVTRFELDIRDTSQDWGWETGSSESAKTTYMSQVALS